MSTDSHMSDTEFRALRAKKLSPTFLRDLHAFDAFLKAHPLEKVYAGNHDLLARFYVKLSAIFFTGASVVNLDATMIVRHALMLAGTRDKMAVAP